MVRLDHAGSREAEPGCGESGMLSASHAAGGGMVDRRRTKTAKRLGERPRRHSGHGRGRKIRLFVADPQAIDRAGLVGLLKREPTLSVVGVAANVEETIRGCRTLLPDLLILTLNLPAQDREAALERILRELPHLRILALSERGAENCLVLNPPSRRWLAGIPLDTCPVGVDCLQLAARQGAMATLRRSANPRDLVRAVRSAARGRTWFDPTTAAGMASQPAKGIKARRLFTERESQVAALLAEGHSNKEISSLLGIGEPTIKKFLSRILRKLGLKDRLQAGLLLARNPILLDHRVPFDAN